MESPQKNENIGPEFLPLVAIVGRPNVGKSTLFNRLTGSRRAIVGDEPGITRDRLYGIAEWQGRSFRIVDTGGIIPDEKEIIPANILKQAQAAIEEASLILLVVDARAGMTPLDEQLAELARHSNRPVFVAANKVDAARIEAEAMEFGRWGFDVYPVSAEHSAGVGDLLDAIMEVLPGTAAPVEEAEDKTRPISISVIGRPNVGKSSLVNKLIGAERVIVSPIPGTTRDAVDTDLVREGQSFRLIDTAGIRRKGKTELVAEKISVIMARRHLERADIAVLLIDGIEGPTSLDATIGGYAHEAGVGLIIAVNKWDALERTEDTAKQFERRIREMMKFADYAPIIYISAKTGHNVGRIFEMAAKINEERNKRIPTSELNRFFERHLAQPRASTPTRTATRVLYMTQAGVRPPTFVFFTTSRDPKSRLHFSYERYITNRLREEFSFFGTPIKIVQRGKKKRAQQD